MVNVFDTISTISSWIGTITAVIFYIAPGFIIYGLYLKKLPVEAVSGVAIISCFFNCYIWVISVEYYEAIVWCNFIGALFCFIWSVMYFYYATRPTKNNFLYGVYLFTILDVSIELLLLYWFTGQGQGEEKQPIVKYIAVLFNIFMYLTPGVNIMNVFRLKDHRLISLPSSVLGCINSFIWMIFGIFSKQKHVFIPNIVGFIISISLIILYQMFYKEYPDDLMEKMKKSNRSNSDLSMSKQYDYDEII